MQLYFIDEQFTSLHLYSVKERYYDGRCILYTQQSAIRYSTWFYLVGRSLIFTWFNHVNRVAHCHLDSGIFEFLGSQLHCTKLLNTNFRIRSELRSSKSRAPESMLNSNTRTEKAFETRGSYKLAELEIFFWISIIYLFIHSFCTWENYSED